MDKRLYSAPYLAIPLTQNTNSTLSPQPNFLVIENIFGRMEAEIPTMGTMVCANSMYKLVYREILPANEQLGRVEEMREIVYEAANQAVPMLIVPALSDYNYLLAGIANVNQMLQLFQFRGVLQGFQLSVDATVLNEILTPEE